MPPLKKYRDKRDFEKTPEPAGEPDSAGGAPGRPIERFVVHEHHARRLHWDLRLERDGVLKSWALPRGLPTDPKRNNLAVHTEDHPIEYIDFAGTIPAGEYGAGEMKIFDHGTYEAEKFRDDEVIFTLHGEREPVKYALFRTRGDDWMIHRMTPAPEGSEPMPERVAPMLATLGELPADDERWAYEIKWDGVRAVAYLGAGSLRLMSRNDRDVTAQYPEVRPLARTLAGHEVVLDGEIVALDDRGLPSFERLQPRMHVARESAVRRLMSSTPVVYMVFDVLWLDGRSTLALSYQQRRVLLAALDVEGPAWKTPAHHIGDGEAMLAASAAQGLEGVVAKRLDCPYEPGRRSRNWIKIKNHRSHALVVGGWLPGQGGRAKTIGALLVGHQTDAGLRYAGRVGSGLDEAELAMLQRLLEPLHREESPFTGGGSPPKGSRFVEPRLVAEVRFTEWTRSGTLRHPVFLGLRDDLDPCAVYREE